MNPLDQHSYFFDEGIRFGCRRCGACCTGAPGLVRIDAAEIAAVAGYLGLPEHRVVDVYLDPWQNGHRIKEATDGRCLFFEAGCRVYPVRPRQCRTFPFWFANLRSEARWEIIRRQCPGIGTGRRYTKAEILDILTP
jgi:uncharacterized protein